MTLLHQAAQKAVGAALRRAYSLGQIYWRLADSDSYLKNAKASTTQKQFDALVQETLATIQQQPEPVSRADFFQRVSRLSELWADDHADHFNAECNALADALGLNAAAPPALQQQVVPREPVAWRYRYSPKQDWKLTSQPTTQWAADHSGFEEEPLYASPSTTRQQEVGSVPPAKLVNGQWEGVPLSQFPELQEQVRKGLADGSIQIGCGDAPVEWTPEDEKRLDDALAKRADTRAAAPSTPEKAGGVSEPARGNTTCNPHPDAPHGFNRNASHNAGRYVCDCEGWMPPPPSPIPHPLPAQHNDGGEHG